MKSESEKPKSINDLSIVKYLISRTQFKEADQYLKARSLGRSTQDPVTYEYVRIALLLGNYGEVYSRYNALKASNADPILDEFYVEALMRERKFDEALHKIKSLEKSTGHSDSLVRSFRLVTSLQRMQKQFEGRKASQRQLSAYCINLDEQVQKWDRAVHVASQFGLVLDRVPGVNGSHIPDGVFSRFGENVKREFKGTLGCFLSHYRAWEKFLVSKGEFALILEDDFVPRVDLPDNFISTGLDEKFDLCWLNDRMSLDRHDDFSFVPVDEIVAQRASPSWAGNGADAYLLSRSGAIKLISRVNEDGFYGDVDWRMLAYSLTDEEITSLPIESYARWALTAHCKVIKPREALNSFAASTGLFKTIGGSSIREEMNTSKHAHVGIVRRIDLKSHD